MTQQLQIDYLGRQKGVQEEICPIIQLYVSSAVSTTDVGN